MTTVCSPVPREVWREVQAADPASLPEHRPEWVDAICAAGQFSDASRLYSFPDGRRFVPGASKGPFMVDVSGEAPWNQLRGPA